jgi:hypothetical protein
MNTRPVLAACVPAGLVTLMMICGSGVAVADDLVGHTYDDASSTLSDEGVTPKVMTTVGDQKDRGKCVVVSAFNAPFVGGADGTHVSDEKLLNLNCYAVSASTKPGYSPSDQSLDAKAVRDAEAKAAAESEESVTAANQH